MKGDGRKETREMRRETGDVRQDINFKRRREKGDVRSFSKEDGRKETRERRREKGDGRKETGDHFRKKT